MFPLSPPFSLIPNTISNTYPSTRFTSHSRWVIMLIVLAVGFIALAIIGTWLHRRYRRKREEAENAFPRPTMQAWAPHQGSVHDVGNFGKEVEAGVGVGEKGKGKEAQKGKGKETGTGRLVAKLRRGKGRESG